MSELPIATGTNYSDTELTSLSMSRVKSCKLMPTRTEKAKTLELVLRPAPETKSGALSTLTKKIP